MRLATLVTLVGSLTSAAVAGCGGDSAAPGPASAPSNDAEIDRAVRNVGWEELPPESEERIVSSEPGVRVVDGRSERCIFQRVNGFKHFDELATLNPNVDSIFPGALIQTIDLPNGLARPINLERGTTRIVLSTGYSQGSYAREVRTPSLATVTQAMGEMLQEGSVSASGGLSVSVQEVYSLEHVAATFGFKGKAMGAKLSALFDGAFTSAMSTFAVTLSQSYFSISAEPPSAPAAVFGPSVTAQSLDPYMGPGNPPALVSTVTYGRVLYLSIQTTRRRQEVEAALSAAWAKSGAEASATAQFEQVFEDMSIKALAVGGDPQVAAEINNMSPRNYRAILNRVATAGARFSPDSPAMPITYVVRRLADNSLLKLGSTLDYTVPVCDGDLSRERIRVREVTVTRNGQSVGKAELTWSLFAQSSVAENVEEVLVPQQGIASVGDGHRLLEGRTFEITAARRSDAWFDVVLVAQGKNGEGFERPDGQCRVRHTWSANPITGSGGWTNFDEHFVKSEVCRGQKSGEELRVDMVYELLPPAAGAP